MCPLGLFCCLRGVLGLLAPVHRCGRSQLDIVALHKVKPTLPNMAFPTTLTFPEWQMYYNPHPDSNVNGVALVVKNTLDPFVKRGPDTTAKRF